MSITMEKQALLETLYLRVGMMDEGSEEYEQFNDIVLTMLGVLDPDGTLAPAYADSPFWTLTDDDVLMPSVTVELIEAMLRTSDITTITEALAGMGLTGQQVDVLRKTIEMHKHEWKHIDSVDDL